MRTALVTGGNRGIGLAACRLLARAGLRVVLGSRSREAGEAAARELREAGAEVRAEVLDVASDRSLADCARRLHDAGLHVDVLLNNAGVYPTGGVLDASEEAWREALEVNLLGPLRTCRAFVPGMVRRGYGRVVNVSSGYGAFAEGLEGPAPYGVSKAALNALTVKLAQEVSGDVKVNACCPGWVATRMGGAGAPLDPVEGADTAVWLATLPRSGPSGGFFRERRRIDW